MVLSGRAMPITPPPFPFGREADALWRTVESDRKRNEDRFDKLDAKVDRVEEGVGEIKASVEAIKQTEEKRASSAKKRDDRIWQVFSACLIAALIGLGGLVYKTFFHVAKSGMEARPETVLETLDRVKLEHPDGQR